MSITARPPSDLATRRLWEQRLDALETELARGRRAARTPAGGEPSPPAESGIDADKADPSSEGNTT